MPYNQTPRMIYGCHIFSNGCHIFQTTDLKSTIRPVKTKNDMLWTNCPNLSIIQWLTRRESKFYYKCADQKKM